MGLCFWLLFKIATYQAPEPNGIEMSFATKNAHEYLKGIDFTGDVKCENRDNWTLLCTVKLTNVDGVAPIKLACNRRELEGTKGCNIVR